MSATNEQMQIAKEILIAVIEKEGLTMMRSANYNGEEGVSKYNDLRITEINRAYTSILNNIVESQSSAGR